MTEERLSATEAVGTRKRFAGGRLVEEERFAADGKLDERIAYSYDASGPSLSSLRALTRSVSRSCADRLNR